jgi:hypothetical protein
VSPTLLESDLVALVAARILDGAVLLAPDQSVGPYHEATDAVDSFACIDRADGVIGTWAEFKTLEETTYGLDIFDHYEEDHSAFAAALAFVRRAGASAVLAALAAREAA